jgi:hypothetical protein
MNKIMQKINNFELKLIDEFGRPLYKNKGKLSCLISELDLFLKEKGLSDGKHK